MLPTDATIKQVSATTVHYPYRAPMKFGGRIVEAAVLQRVRVQLEDRAGKRQASGVGEMTLGSAWAWPSQVLSPAQVEQIVIDLADRAAWAASQLKMIDHPLRLSRQVVAEVTATAVQLAADRQLPEPIPQLAVLVACAAVDAAILDAYGRLHRRSSFQLLGQAWTGADMGHFLGPRFEGLDLDQFVCPTPHPSLGLYHLVGALDPLTASEIDHPVRDGLPETLEAWIQREGLSHLKIKLAGDDLNWDVGRVTEVDRVANRVATDRHWHYSLDFNERCSGEDYVLDLLERVGRLSATALPRIQYVEQPTSRHLAERRDLTMYRISRIKPVVIDESLLGIDSLLTARQLGYNGIAVKSCKGQGESLLLAAAAQHLGMRVYVQDLTCIGGSFLQSAALAAHLPGVTAVEGNGRQYCPIGNRDWEERFPPLFHIRSGAIPTELLSGEGIGFEWPEKLLRGLKPPARNPRAKAPRKPVSAKRVAAAALPAKPPAQKKVAPPPASSGSKPKQAATDRAKSAPPKGQPPTVKAASGKPATGKTAAGKPPVVNSTASTSDAAVRSQRSDSRASSNQKQGAAKGAAQPAASKQPVAKRIATAQDRPARVKQAAVPKASHPKAPVKKTSVKAAPAKKSSVKTAPAKKSSARKTSTPSAAVSQNGTTKGVGKKAAAVSPTSKQFASKPAAKRPAGGSRPGQPPPAKASQAKKVAIKTPPPANRTRRKEPG
jgi:L-alanine-DL-glutamate epimerase-like enolase superfamily enzyme